MDCNSISSVIQKDLEDNAPHLSLDFSLSDIGFPTDSAKGKSLLSGHLMAPVKAQSTERQETQLTTTLFRILATKTTTSLTTITS